MDRLRRRAKRASAYRGLEPQPSGAAFEEPDAANLQRRPNRHIAPRLGSPGNAAARGKSTECSRVKLLNARRQIIPLPPVGRPRQAVKLGQRSCRGVRPGEPSVRGKVLPALEVPGKPFE